MSVLLFGVSHRSAPVSVLEQLSTDEAEQAKIIELLLQSSLVTEAMVLSTCNRVEVYAVVDAFHGGLSVIGSVLSERSGMSLHDLTKYAYVRYAEAAVEHLFAVASGLDSAVIGEAQVLGQVRRAYTSAEAHQTVGRTLHELSQRALSVGKRVHSETGIDAAGASVVSVALDMAKNKLTSLTGLTAAVIGAGSMGALAAAHLTRAGIARVEVVNRSLPRAERMVENLKAQGIAVALDDFGTGYSSIGYLRRFRFDSLKIDKSLAGRVDCDAQAAEMVRGTVRIARALGMTVVAEGVEDLQQLTLLRRAGCDRLQGYYFSKPMPIADLLQRRQSQG